MHRVRWWRSVMKRDMCRAFATRDRTSRWVSGPERIQSGWWDGGDVARDYYIARTADAAQWWVFRECTASRRWFVHGCFA